MNSVQILHAKPYVSNMQNLNENTITISCSKGLYVYDPPKKDETMHLVFVKKKEEEEKVFVLFFSFFSFLGWLGVSHLTLVPLNRVVPPNETFEGKQKQLYILSDNI